MYNALYSSMLDRLVLPIRTMDTICLLGDNDTIEEQDRLLDLVDSVLSWSDKYTKYLLRQERLGNLSCKQVRRVKRYTREHILLPMRDVLKKLDN